MRKIIHADGRVETEEPTRSSPEGDAPRAADGRLIGADGLLVQPAPAAAEPTAAEPGAPEEPLAPAVPTMPTLPTAEEA